MFTKKPFKTDASVRVVYDTAKSSSIYSSLEEAKVHFPELNPDLGSYRFTSAMHDSDDGSIMRFESWNSYNLLSK